MEPKDWLLCLQDPPLVHILGEVKAVTPACPVSLEAICIIAHHTHTVLDCPNVFFPLGISDVHFDEFLIFSPVCNMPHGT